MAGSLSSTTRPKWRPVSIYALSVVCVRRLHTGTSGQSENGKGAGRGRGLDWPADQRASLWEPQAQGLQVDVRLYAAFVPTPSFASVPGPHVA
jgi:hypothetical protein